MSSLILLVYGLTTGNINGWDTPDVIATLATAVCLLAIFVFLEVKVSQDPILPGYMFEDRVRVLGCAAAALTYAVWQGSNYLLTLQLQSTLSIPRGISSLPLNISADEFDSRLRVLTPVHRPPLPSARHHCLRG